MKVSFSIFPHPNITSAHKNSLEFTKEDFVTPQGDCLVGIKADYDLKKVQQLLQSAKKIKITIQTKSAKDELECIPNKDFCDENEMVIRKSEFLSDRTLGIRSTKGANDLKDELKQSLAKEKAIVTLQSH